ncbi:MAG: LptF/LptG family permease [Thermodesulfobacteriota bacterium]|nr:LptF/LptG family permease [Thermodesulfobacteriota bacterium]
MLVYRYILSQLVKSFLGALGVLFCVAGIVEWVQGRGVISITDIDVMLLAMVPIATFALPMALLFSVLIVLERLSSDSEIVALDACGVPRRSIYIPVMCLCMFCMVVHLGVSTYLGPISLDKIKQRLLLRAPQKIYAFVEERDFETIFKGFVIYIEAVDRKQNELSGIFIESRGSTPSIITADKGSLNFGPSGIVMKLKDGSIFMNQAQTLRYITFDEYKFCIEAGLGRKLGIKTYETATQASLRDMIRDNPEPRWIKEYHMRLAFPALNLILCVIGITFGIKRPRSARHTGFLIGVMTIFGYYMIFVFADRLVKGLVMNPVLGAWLPNIVFTCMILVTWAFRMRRRVKS